MDYPYVVAEGGAFAPRGKYHLSPTKSAGPVACGAAPRRNPFWNTWGERDNFELYVPHRICKRCLAKEKR